MDSEDIYIGGNYYTEKELEEIGVPSLIKMLRTQARALNYMKDEKAIVESERDIIKELFLEAVSKPVIIKGHY